MSGMHRLPSLAQIQHVHSTVLKCCSPICFIDYFQVNLEKTMLLADPRTLTGLIGKKDLVPPPSDLKWCRDLLPVQVVSNEPDFSNCRRGGGQGTRRRNKAVRVHPLLVGRHHDSLSNWLLKRGIVGVPPIAMYLIKMVSLVQSLI